MREDLTIDLDRPVHDQLMLRTVAGAVDYLAEELRTLPATVLRPWPRCATSTSARWI